MLPGASLLFDTALPGPPLADGLFLPEVMPRVVPVWLGEWVPFGAFAVDPPPDGARGHIQHLGDPGCADPVRAWIAGAVAVSGHSGVQDQISQREGIVMA